MYIKFLRQLLYFSAAAGTVAALLSFILPQQYISPALPFLFLFFISASLLSFFFLLKSTGKRLIRFVNAFLLTILLKLILYIGVMVAYALLNRTDAVPFLVSFFILYLIYMVFETVFIIKYSRNPNKESD
ncbi:MAG: hypothetical protein NT004_12860 [Bacteroidetes bacterium]|nr:hypothetical protein [Bacteroidota bacterium]